MRRTRKIWTEEDLDLIFTTLPTRKSAEKLGKVMDRTPDSIELAWRFSVNTKKRNKELELNGNGRGKWAERCRKAKIRNDWIL